MFSLYHQGEDKCCLTILWQTWRQEPPEGNCQKGHQPLEQAQATVEKCSFQQTNIFRQLNCTLINLLIVDCVFGNDKLCCFCPRPESTFWSMTQNASTQNLKFPILLFHINKVGARINQMGHHFNKMGARINKMGHSESTKCGAPTICKNSKNLRFFP